MRLFPILIAGLVCVALFFVVLEREALLGFARDMTGEAAAAQGTPPEEEVVAEPVAISDTATDAASDPVHVVAMRSVAREVPDAVMVRGQSEAAREVVVMAETTGTVVSEPLRKGAFVEADQLLCELDPGSRGATLSEAEARLAEAQARVPEAEARIPEAQARVAEAEARLQEARINQNAASRLSEGGFASDTRVANADAALRSAEAGVTAASTGLETMQAGIKSARAGVQAAEAAVERARLDIEKLRIKAPFAGLLETDTAELGALLQPGTPCATVVQLDPMKLVGFLPEAQVDRVAVGAMAGARLASGVEAQGEVTFLSRSADDLTRTFRVEVTVPNPDLEIRDGQTAEILIETPATVAHMIPASALTLNDEGQLGLRIIEDGLAGFTPVTLVRDTVDGVLLSGLPATVEVITVGQEYVTDGVPVRATFAEPEATQ
ncbi:efflux RND transporter periplasmic adaptor subunit [Jannaschia sp. S6380]|uniref:efflux RND transporter periplasmic adaptor subunit n=1 Tax=Jannaschia sp. S6380 TaxID=2926408 RepID=UPI001FF2C57B|nr:efflux RND transporter periplasmic adaptor subunit [Jannaschia sp. S6380]MCK0167110.1 efflux RND transporter periplasmic adaptor subunit [Jannaschia sp. S6380]